ncbi:hypothetical protein B9J78_03895 [bacterium Unc6]|nr:hypothetical protein [bacterium Unc6]
MRFRINNYLKEKSPQIANRKCVVAIAFIAKTLFPFLQDHYALKEQLESEIRRLLPQPQP